MHWNYRVVRHKYKSADGEVIEEYYAIHEAYFGKDGLVHSITKEPVPPHDDTVKGLKQVLMLMRRALDKPILDYDDIPEKPKLKAERKKRNVTLRSG